jgi:hypothetical protein
MTTEDLRIALEIFYESGGYWITTNTLQDDYTTEN